MVQLDFLFSSDISNTQKKAHRNAGNNTFSQEDFLQNACHGICLL